jgi:hypothetical protein
MSCWYEILYEAAEGTVEEMLAELAPGGGRRVLRGRDVDLEPGDLPEHLLARLGARTHHLLLAPEAEARAFAAGLAARGLAVERLREVTGGSFPFEVLAYSREVRDDIRARLTAAAAPPLALSGFRESEESDPEAAGVELFAPAHAYTYRASGTISGPCPGLLDLYLRAREHDFVHPGRLELAARELPPGALVDG